MTVTKFYLCKSTDPLLGYNNTYRFTQYGVWGQYVQICTKKKQ